jgi:D-hydroxyproline dehydrogenase subunit gamma
VTRDITIVIDGVPRRVPEGDLLAAVLLSHDVTTFRRDTHEHPRAPVCGMGTCHECRVTVDGVDGVRACLVPVRDGMRVETAR